VVFVQLLILCATECSHEDIGLEPAAPGEVLSSVAGLNYTQLGEGRPVEHELSLNMTRLYLYENINVTTMGLPDRYRKLILALEPCEGVVYLFVRRTRRCWPAPHSCCQPLPDSGLPPDLTAPPCNLAAHKIKCHWTHFHSVIDGTQDAAPTFFEVPLGSTKHLISVYAPYEVNMRNGVRRPRYRLTALADIGAYPRPGLQGRLHANQVADMSVELSWDQATFVPMGISDLRHYHVYSSLLLPEDQRTSDAVFVSLSKVMNSVCGLERNAVKYGRPLDSAACSGGHCKVVLSGIVPRRRYMFNIVSESYRGFQAAYSGVVVTADWMETSKLVSDGVMGLIGAICGTVFGVVVIGYLWIVKLYK